MSQGDSGKDKAAAGGSDSGTGDRVHAGSELVDMTDENMLNWLLIPKVRGEAFEEEKHVKPLHRGEPVAYLNSNAVSIFVPIVYFYKEMVPLKYKKETANVRYDRSAGDDLGNWKSTGEKLAWKDDNGEVVGYRNGLIYIPMKNESPDHQHWTYNMREISMPGSHLSICELQRALKTKGKGKANAQACSSSVIPTTGVVEVAEAAEKAQDSGPLEGEEKEELAASQRAPKTKGKANAQACSSSVIPATDVVKVAEAAEKAQDSGPLEGEEKEELAASHLASEDHRDGIAEDSVSTIASVDELIQAGEAQLS